MKKLMFFAFFLIVVGAYAQDHNSVRGRMDLIGKLGIEAYELSLIRTGPGANTAQVVQVDLFEYRFWGWSYVGSGVSTLNANGPFTSFIPTYPGTFERVKILVYVMVKQKNMEIWDWEIYDIIVDLEPGKTSYRVEGVRVQ